MLEETLIKEIGRTDNVCHVSECQIILPSAALDLINDMRRLNPSLNIGHDANYSDNTCTTFVLIIRIKDGA